MTLRLLQSEAQGYNTLLLLCRCSGVLHTCHTAEHGLFLSILVGALPHSQHRYACAHWHAPAIASTCRCSAVSKESTTHNPHSSARCERTLSVCATASSAVAALQARPCAHACTRCTCALTVSQHYATSAATAIAAALTATAL